ncbi:3-keto-disaccharide hydrolase [Flavobacterium sp. W21_SRS_FM6]|uniref:3-keto-disaccharide hydrolase n=1 Tax=Flavobacterium sp. W21_SRS_FM6 TaxID=3240268 RepID=UPI003F90C04C
MKKLPIAVATVGLLASTSYITVYAEEKALEPWQEAEKTEVWSPVPPIVSTLPGQVPSDAIVLIDSQNLDQWETLDGGVPEWTIDNGKVTVKPGTGDIKSKQAFCDVQLHMEWQVPQPSADMKGQQRNNSGIFFQQRYEIQVLDSYNNPTYSNGQAASVYKQTIPLANAMRPPQTWQVYDIIYKAPRFEGEKLSTPGYVTVIHNGVVVQNHTEIQGSTEWIGAPKYVAHGCAPLQLQDHGNLVSFRNMWVREL